MIIRPRNTKNEVKLMAITLKGAAVITAALIGFAAGHNIRTAQYIHCEGEHQQVMRAKGQYSAGFSEGMAAGRHQKADECVCGE